MESRLVVLPFCAFSWGILWALKRWSKMYIISPPRLIKSSGNVFSDIVDGLEKITLRTAQITHKRKRWSACTPVQTASKISKDRHARRDVNWADKMAAESAAGANDRAISQTLSGFTPVVLLISLVVYRLWRQKKTLEKNYPPLHAGWIPWVGCAVEFGREPVFFIDTKRKEVRWSRVRFRSFDFHDNHKRWLSYKTLREEAAGRLVGCDCMCWWWCWGYILMHVLLATDKRSNYSWHACFFSAVGSNFHSPGSWRAVDIPDRTWGFQCLLSIRQGGFPNSSAVSCSKGWSVSNFHLIKNVEPFSHTDSITHTQFSQVH